MPSTSRSPCCSPMSCTRWTSPPPSARNGCARSWARCSAASSAIVQRYGGTVDKFTGDGIMAVFGAPIALEDHAVRACRAALDIQTDAQTPGGGGRRAATDRRLQLRIGLNSGEVITGEIGSGPMTYTAVGEQVGMAQRMESVAPPGGVMVSDSTARLVDTVALLGETELVHIKGARNPVPAHRLLGMATGRRSDRAEPTFVGRQWEMGALNGVLERSINGSGSVVGVGRAAGNRQEPHRARADRAGQDAGVEVFATYCESHTADVPFHAAAGLVRSTTGWTAWTTPGRAEAGARARFRGPTMRIFCSWTTCSASPIPRLRCLRSIPTPRRRRVAAMVKAVALVRTTRWSTSSRTRTGSTAISESMLAEFPRRGPADSVARRDHLPAGIRWRACPCAAIADDRTRAAGRIADADVGRRTVWARTGRSPNLPSSIAERAAGNPFFAEEIVRDLSERDVLVGGRGCYLCTGPVADVHVPSTLQAVIAARIDRLDPAAKRTLNAAAVIGSRFTPDMLKALRSKLL